MRGSAATVATALVVALTGLGAGPAPAQAAPVTTVSSALPAAAPAAAPVERAPSRRLVVRDIGVNAGIIPVGVNRAGQLAVGTSVHAVYRWRDGVVAGQPGSAVLAGHTWSRGAGVFDRLGELRRGDRVKVGRAVFRVTRVRRVTSMSREDVRELFSDRGEPRLVLITCGDRNNTTGVYRTRIIVNAEKV